MGKQAPRLPRKYDTATRKNSKGSDTFFKKKKKIQLNWVCAMDKYIARTSFIIAH